MKINKLITYKMKTKTLISNACAAIIVALSLVGCSDFDNGFTDKEIAFQEAFRKEFGEIDPEQDWNLATRATLHVDFNEKTNVKVYSAAPFSPGAVLMANYNVSSPSDLGFDMPEGTEKVYVQAMRGKNMLLGGYYKVTDGIVEGVNTTRNLSNMTRSETTASIDEERVLDISVWNGSNAPLNYKLQMLKNVPDSYGSNGNDGVLKKPDVWYVNDMRSILDKDQIFGEGSHNWRKYVKPGILKNDVMYTIQDDGGEMYATLEYIWTDAFDDHFAYFYWEDDDIEGEYPTYKDFQDGKVKLYCLIENAATPKYVTATGDYTAQMGNWNLFAWAERAEGTVQGTTFQLVYFDDKGDASLKFPGGTHIAFAIVRDRFETPKDVSNTDAVWFSLQDMNISSEAWGKEDLFDGENFCTAATFKIGEKVCLGFEDFPDVYGADLNDLMFWVEGDFIEDITTLVPDGDKKQSWILAYEDLGNSFDWDYNDIVLQVEHASGEDYITITPLAAGGTYASDVRFFGTNIGKDMSKIGEIHQLMNQAPAASGAYTPINAQSRGTAGEVITCYFKDYYSDIINNDGGGKDNDDDNDGISDAIEGFTNAFSMSVLGQVNEMGGITLHVHPADGSSEQEAVISYQGPGNVPEVICLPGSWTWSETDADGTTTKYERLWRWPYECKDIRDAYGRFANWVSNKKAYRDWYKDEPNKDYCVQGDDFDKVISTSSPGSGGDDNDDDDDEEDDTSKEEPTFNLRDNNWASVSEYSIELLPNGKHSIYLSDQNTNTGGTITYSSSNNDVATVDNYGNITAIGGGNATITVKQASTDTYKSAKCYVYVNVIDLSNFVEVQSHENNSNAFKISDILAQMGSNNQISIFFETTEIIYSCQTWAADNDGNKVEKGYQAYSFAQETQCLITITKDYLQNTLKDYNYLYISCGDNNKVKSLKVQKSASAKRRTTNQ
ncbi:MAG: Ig-like domain-containing protein [Prevotellaceae bacterium]|nr:Ig-like domain-containing protein [Prevotellaceae bacterium]